MKIMSNHSSARPHTINSTDNQTISEALKLRAQSVINGKSVDAETRAVIRYALEINDPSLTELVRRADAGETGDNLNIPPTSVEKIEALVEIICGDGNKSPAALLVLMATLENASEPQALAHAAKHFAFTRCGELNLYGMVDTQTALLESELLAPNPLT
jgi:plasmid stability protein